MSEPTTPEVPLWVRATALLAAGAAGTAVLYLYFRSQHLAARESSPVVRLVVLEGRPVGLVQPLARA